MNLLRFLAIPTAILGILIAFDAYGPPEHETTVVRLKYLTRDRNFMNDWIRVVGKHTYEILLSTSDASQTNLGDTVEVTASPLRKWWLRVVVKHDGKMMVDLPRKISIYFQGIVTLIFLLPCISLSQRGSKFLADSQTLWVYAFFIEIAALWVIWDWCSNLIHYYHGAG